MDTWRKVPDMSHEDWLIWRGKGLGGSDAPAIMGVSPWCTPYQKWEEKVYGKKQDDNASKKFGRDTEKASRMEYEDLVGYKMNPCNVENIEYPWLRASLDGMSGDGNVIVEIKKTSREDHATALKNRVPKKYIPQCQEILFVTGSLTMDYFSSPASGGRGRIVPVIRDEDYISNELFPKLKEFWAMVQSKTPPPLNDDDFRPLSDPEAWNQASSKWKKLTDSIKRMEEEQEFYKQEMIRLSGGRNVKENGVNLTRSEVSGRIDYEAAIEDYISNMKAHYPEVDFREVPIESYRKESFTKWTVRDIA